MVLALASTIVACSKDDENPTPAPTVVGKWNVNSEIIRTTLGTNVLRNDTTDYPAGFATFEFSSTLMFANVAGMLDTLDYSYVNGKLTLIDFDETEQKFDTTVYNKVTLSTSALVLTDLDTTVTANGSLISEYTVNLSK